MVHDEAGSSLGTGVATARIAREEMIASLENIVFEKYVERLLLSVRLERLMLVLPGLLYLSKALRTY